VLHVMTFAVHHSASVLTIQRWFPGRAAARGQAVYISAAWGIGGTGGSLTAAYLWTLAGPGSAFASGSLAALLGAWALRKARQHDPGLASAHPFQIETNRSVKS
jgi:PPP family 3-phenylpropionic acid transporter